LSLSRVAFILEKKTIKPIYFCLPSTGRRRMTTADVCLWAALIQYIYCCRKLFKYFHILLSSSYKNIEHFNYHSQSFNLTLTKFFATEQLDYIYYRSFFLLMKQCILFLIFLWLKIRFWLSYKSTVFILHNSLYAHGSLVIDQNEKRNWLGNTNLFQWFLSYKIFSSSFHTRNIRS